MSKGQIEIRVVGAGDIGQLHVMATIERAVKRAYSGAVISPDLDDERDDNGNVIAKRPAESVTFLIKDTSPAVASK